MRFQPSISILLLAWVLIGGAGCGGPEPLRFSIRFEDAGDLQPGDLVVFRGVAVGEVTQVRTGSDEVVVQVSVRPEHRRAIYREARFLVSRIAGERPSVVIEEQPGDRTEIDADDVIDARPGWFERLSRRAGEIRDSAEEALKTAGSEIQDAVADFENSPEFQAFKDGIAEAGRDAAALAQARMDRFVQEDLPRLEQRAEAYRDKLKREGRSTEAEIFWKWFQRWANAVKSQSAEEEKEAPRPEREP